MAALAVLTICLADSRDQNESDYPGRQSLIGLTVNEIRRLINALIIRPIRGLAHRLQP